MTDSNPTAPTEVPAASAPDLEAALDQALSDSFPASDPVSIERREDQR